MWLLNNHHSNIECRDYEQLNFRLLDQKEDIQFLERESDVHADEQDGQF